MDCLQGRLDKVEQRGYRDGRRHREHAKNRSDRIFFIIPGRLGLFCLDSLVCDIIRQYTEEMHNSKPDTDVVLYVGAPLFVRHGLYFKRVHLLKAAKRLVSWIGHVALYSPVNTHEVHLNWPEAFVNIG